MSEISRGVGRTGDVIHRRGKYPSALPPAVPTERASAVGTGAPPPRLPPKSLWVPSKHFLARV